MPPQSASEVHVLPGLEFTQCVAGPAPWLQSAGPEPGLPPSVSVVPEVPVIARTELNPSGRLIPAPAPEPEYRQPRPRSASFTPFASSTSPESGGDAGGENPGPPQFAVPGLAVKVIDPSIAGTAGAGQKFGAGVGLQSCG